ncbi:hypothetical protein ATZ33_14695 [Enterococcus silesiacus]|nr:hypothetical protein [Enterococcus silesiacus]ALS02579.1 hypothetical protein ATZ33_14695 [Enterococcus silesiacus]
MKKKLILLATVTLAVLTACQSGKNTAKTKLAEDEQVFTWWADRSKPFGNLEYLEISEKEATELMANKFELKIPRFFDVAKEIIEDDLVSDAVQREPDIYNVVASGNDLVLSSLIKIKDAKGSYLSYGKIELKYQYMGLQKKVKLLSQEVSIYNLSEDETYHGKDATAVLKQLSSLMKLKDQDKLLTKFTEETKESQNNVGKEISLYRTLDKAYKNNSFGKNLVVTFNGAGGIKIIEAAISDYRL